MEFIELLFSEASEIAERNANVSEMTMRHLAFLISTALIDSETRIKYEVEYWKYNEQQARELIAILSQCMPIPGHHCTAHSVKEQGEAIRYRVDLDDFHEQRFKKNNL